MIADRMSIRDGARQLSTGLLHRAQAGMHVLRARRAALNSSPARGMAFTGTIWTGGESQPRAGTVVIDGSGRVADILGPDATLPGELLVLGGPHHWITPGITDAHVHIALEPAGVALSSGLVGLRDLGAPLAQAQRWQTGHRRPGPGLPFVAVAGPILTVDGGYPSRTWGSDGYAEFVRDPAHARTVVQSLASDGVDLIKIAFEPGEAGWPVLGPKVARAIVVAAHSAGLPVLAHALRAEMVSRAVDVGVDELAHTPKERLSPILVERIAAAAISVTSTLQTFFSGGDGRDAAANAADLVEAGVRLRYGTDLANAGTRPGVDPRELDRLAGVGLGRLGALRAATEHSATAPGMRLRTGLITRGQAAELVLLPFSPLAEPGVWRMPSAVFVDGRLVMPPAFRTTSPDTVGAAHLTAQEPEEPTL